MADTEQPLNEPWLVAAWAGMGGVGVSAAVYLVEKLGAKPVEEFAAQELFDLQQVEIKAGLVQPTRLPRSMLLEWRNPGPGRDLVIFVGEAQPQRGGYLMCRHLIADAAKRGVKRVVTFAAMATQLHPSKPPRVFGAVTQGDLLTDLREAEAEVVSDGQISGLNGVLLAAGAERGMPGVCLLGELPFFAAGVPNPRSALAVLEAFAPMAGIEVDLDELRASAEEAEAGLLELLDHLRSAARERAESEGEADEPFELTEGGPDEGAEPTEPAEDAPTIDEPTRRRIEVAFREAERDRDRAFELKELLDRHGAFDQYEDRFLDLFKKAE